MQRLISIAALLSAFVAIRADAPRVVAIRAARIVTAAGPPIESGTIVIRGGTIDAVGPSVAVPNDAQVIEGRGLTVYPGLIDLGNTRAAEQPAPQAPNARTTAELERWRRLQILKPQFRAADALRVDDPELTRLASAGITTVLALPSGDVISGQSALVNVVAPPDEPQIGNVVEGRRGLVIVRNSVALHVSFPDRPREAGTAYPGSLMGVIAFVRQSFLDAQHYALTKQPDDPALEALQPALDRKLPVAFEAKEAREILRALKMAKELKLDPIITGGLEANEAVTELKGQNARVIYSLNYPQRPRTLAPDADEPYHAMRERADAPKTPGELAKAGIPFGFSTAGLGEPRDFVRNAIKAVKAGLAEDAAIRSLTLGAATIAGADQKLGSIEKGKIANLVVTDGSLFDEKTKITKVFVEGRSVSLDATPPAPAGRGRGREGR